MTDAARKLRNQKAREWRRNNPEKVKAAQERYWERKAAQIQERRAQGTEHDKNGSGNTSGD